MKRGNLQFFSIKCKLASLCKYKWVVDEIEIIAVLADNRAEVMRVILTTVISAGAAATLAVTMTVAMTAILHLLSQWNSQHVLEQERDLELESELQLQ